MSVRRATPTRHQDIPASGPAREALRQRGQFWTPDWVADAMVAYVLKGGVRRLFDPAVGAGAFLRAAKREVPGGRLAFSGREVSRAVLAEARAAGLTDEDLSGIEIRDFVLDPPRMKFPAIVANPPYIRHHRLDREVKANLRAMVYQVSRIRLDGRAGLHVYFLVQALQLLDYGGRLAFIIPADTVEGVFAEQLWRWIASRFRIEGVVTFAAEATPFPGVDTNPLIVMIRARPPSKTFMWARCYEWGTPGLAHWVRLGFPEREVTGLEIHKRDLEEALTTGLSRAPCVPATGADVLRLGHFATVMRGIATGANDFFFLTRRRAMELGIPNDFLRPAVGRTRDVPGYEVTEETLATLENAGRPNVLFCPDGRPLEGFPGDVQRYLIAGVMMGVPDRALIRTRRPWYRMETRTPPPILFAYLGRRNSRFIRNRVGVVPLTAFLCVYPKRMSGDEIEGLWRVLQRPETLSGLRLVGKSYGSGALKVEPRGLERLPLDPVQLREEGVRVDVHEPFESRLPF